MTDPFADVGRISRGGRDLGAASHEIVLATVLHTAWEDASSDDQRAIYLPRQILPRWIVDAVGVLSRGLSRPVSLILCIKYMLST